MRFHRNETRRLQCEALERRDMLAVVSWDGGANTRSWSDAENWDSDQLPQESDSVFIGTSFPVDVEDVSVRIQSVDTSALLIIREGSELTLTEGESFMRGTNIDSGSVFGNGSLIIQGQTTSLFVLADSFRPRVFKAADGATAEVAATFVTGESLEATSGATIVFSDSASAEYEDVSVVEGAEIRAPKMESFNGDGFGGEIRIDTGGVIHFGTEADPEPTHIEDISLFIGPGSAIIAQGIVLSDGSMSGQGFVLSDVVLGPSSQLSVSQLTITGNLEQSSGSWITLVLSDDYVPLSVRGNVTLLGRLHIGVADGFALETGESFPFISGASIENEFRSVSIDANSTGRTFQLNYSARSIEAQVLLDTGPQVADIEVAGEDEALEYIDVFFEESIDFADFDREGFHLFRRSGEGAREPIDVEDYVVFRVVDQTGDPSEHLRIWPRNVMGNGEYEIVVGPNVFNQRGNLMDTDGDGVFGEVEDVVSRRFVIEDQSAPQVASVVGSISAGPITEFLVTFTERVLVESFDPSDIVFLDEQGSRIDIPLTIEPQRVSNRDGFRVFGTQNDDLANDAYLVRLETGIPNGEMTVEIGPDIVDVNDHPLNQDGDGVFGEATDRFVAELLRPSPLSFEEANGNGVFVEAFLNPAEVQDITPTLLERRTPDFSTVAERIDFTRDHDGTTWTGADSVTRPLSDFFGPYASLEDSFASRPMVSFRLRNSFLLPIREEMDLDPSTPEIDIRVAVGSDDGFSLSIGGAFLGSDIDRGFSYTWIDLAFATEGLYPTDLLYYANNRGHSGLQFAWETATSGGETAVPAEELFLDTTRIDRGDVNADGRIDSIDLGRLLNQFGDQSRSMGWTDGDLNNDEVVDSIDLGELLNQFGEE